MKINLQIKNSDKLAAKVSKLFADKESLIKEMETRHSFLYSFLMEELNSDANHDYEHSMKITKLMHERDFLKLSINQLTK